jgi:hypothetical protein
MQGKFLEDLSKIAFIGHRILKKAYICLMKNSPLFLCILLLLIGVTSCSTTRTIATWESEGLTPTAYKKMVVYVSASTLATRSTIERTLAKQFSKKNVETVAASDKLPNLVIDTFYISEIQSALGSQNADLFLYVNLGGITLTQVTEEGGVSSHTGFKTGGGTYVKTLTRIENRLYHAVKGKLLMSVDTESDAGPQDDVEDVAQDLASELISKFKKKAIVFPK